MSAPNLERERKLLIAQLLASRDQLLATIGQIDVALLALDVDVTQLDDQSAPDCPHPRDEIVNHHTTLDEQPDDFECSRCGARQPTPFHPED